MDAYFFASDYCKMYKTGGWRERDVLDQRQESVSIFRTHFISCRNCIRRCLRNLKGFRKENDYETEECSGYPVCSAG